MRVETVKCDQCGAIKGEGDHWLLIDVQNRSTGAPGTPRIVIPPDDKLLDGYQRRDLCGQACFHKHLDALLFPERKTLVLENCIFHNAPNAEQSWKNQD